MASLGTWPSTIRPRTCRFEFVTNQIVNESPFNSYQQVVDRLNDSWACHLTLPVRRHAQAAEIEAFLANFRGQVNWISLWHFVRPAPRGTLRGTLLTSGTQAQGASSLVLSGGTAGGTLLGGDLLGAGSQLIMVAPAGATADGAGNITVPLVNRLRAAIATAQSVTWDKPSAPFRLLSHSGVNYIPGSSEEVTMILREKVGS
jgi:hypothetical protein